MDIEKIDNEFESEKCSTLEQNEAPLEPILKELHSVKPSIGIDHPPPRDKITRRVGLDERNSSNPPYKIDQIIDSIIKDINFTNSLDIKIIENQERTWLQFGRTVPLSVKKQVSPIIKERTGLKVKWLRGGTLVIEFFAEDELAEIRHRRSKIKTEAKQASIKIKEEQEEWKVQTARRKKRETIPDPQTLTRSVSTETDQKFPKSYLKSQNYNRRNLPAFQSKSYTRAVSQT